MPAGPLLDHIASRRDDMTALLTTLIEAESPSNAPASQEGVQHVLAGALRDVGYRVRPVPGHSSGGQLLGVPADRRRGDPLQLVLGHCDTVWPLGTVERRPVRVKGNRLYGPGSYDMKAGLVQGIFALGALHAAGLPPAVDPVVFVNSDEEIGSRESGRHIHRLARAADRSLILEPSLGPDGKLKTGRKGIARFTIRITGRAAHAGLDPGKGASAILELSNVVQRLFELNDPERGISVNVGTIEGGIQPNVVAPESSAVVDVRVWRHDDARYIEAAIGGLQASVPGTTVEVEGGFGRPPMERTRGNGELWERARSAAQDLGFDVEEGAAGGGSDGNTTSLYAPTLDGLGAVGDGAHAEDEFVYLDQMVERSALVARLLLEPEMQPASAASARNGR
jgi:glutamate carboxypeptidase